MRDVHERDADVLLDALELDLQLLAQAQVERAERLVEQQRARPVDERAGERHALLLAAGELAGLALPRRPSCTSSSASPTRVRTSSLETFRRSRPNATFFSTLRCGKSA